MYICIHIEILTAVTNIMVATTSPILYIVFVPTHAQPTFYRRQAVRPTYPIYHTQCTLIVTSYVEYNIVSHTILRTSYTTNIGNFDSITESRDTFDASWTPNMCRYIYLIYAVSMHIYIICISRHCIYKYHCM